MNTLVVYYSLDGNTKAAAERIAKELGCKTMGIEPEKPITNKGFMKILVGGKQSAFNEKPAIKPLGADLAEYDMIVLGTPVWAGKAAAPVWTFANSCDACEKVIALFTLSGSGENEKCLKQLKNVFPGIRISASLKDKKADKNGENEEILAAFIAQLRAAAQ